MLRSSTKLKLPTNFDAISKNVKILKIGPVEPKLWKICQIAQKRFEFLTEEAKDRWRGVWLLNFEWTLQATYLQNKRVFNLLRQEGRVPKILMLILIHY